MSNNYYEELMLEMQLLMQEEAYDKVVVRLEQELSMPYVPMAYEASYASLLKQANSILRANQKPKKELMDEETIHSLLFDESLETQLLAVEGLKQTNLRIHMPTILAYLANPIYEETQSLLIYELIDQQVRDGVVTIKDGMRIEFIPYYLELPEQTDGFLASVAYLQSHLEKNPSLLQLCLQLLQIVLMKKLPLSFEEDEVESLCGGLIHYACNALNDEQTWQEFVTKTNIHEENCIKIEIE